MGNPRVIYERKESLREKFGFFRADEGWVPETQVIS